LECRVVHYDSSCGILVVHPGKALKLLLSGSIP
jgi:hypothetical protein